VPYLNFLTSLPGHGTPLRIRGLPALSAVINRVIAGEEIEIVRNGAAVARLTAPAKKRLLSPAEFRVLVASLPPIDDEFAADVRTARESIGSPEAPVWPS
jgi:antitoxin (DNA-binding transcriptional repressor) of toxin-antitoxin stability system